MGQLSQLVLLASIVASCISFSIDSTKNMPVPEPPVEPSESDFSEFPTEFMNKLIATLSPEELKELQKPTILGESNLVDRDGNTDKTPCRSLEDNSTKGMPFPEPAVEPSESDFSEFPTEFMNNLIASLSPEELEELQKPTILGESSLVDREGNTDKKPCRRHQDIRNYQVVKATDGEHYFVITNLKDNYQPVEHYACDVLKANDTYDNKCEPANPLKFTGYCCHQQKATTSLYVNSLPTRYFKVRNGNLYLKSTNEKYKVYEMIKKDVLMNSDCKCDQYRPAIAYGNNYSCPSNPDSKLFI